MKESEAKINSAAEVPEPIIGDYSIIFDHRTAIPMLDGFVFGDAPSLSKTSDGALLCAIPLMIKGTPVQETRPLHFFRSEDGGTTWEKLPVQSDFCAGTLYRYKDSLYFIGTGPVHRSEEGAVRIIRSRDDGCSWSEPVDIFKGAYLYQPAGGYVIRDGQFYWCFDSGHDSTYALVGDLERDLTDPGAWRVSEPLRYPGTPPSLMTSDTILKVFSKSTIRWLEGNVIDTEDGLRVCWRLSLSGNRKATKNLALICDLEDDGDRLRYSFAHFYPWPGATNHFHVIRDEEGSGYYWMTSNLQFTGATPEFTASMKESKGGERRLLALHCSADALHWIQVGWVAVWPLMRQSSNYCGMLIDGDDLLVASRTSRNAPNQHDNDVSTFHRIKNFRRLTEPISPCTE